MPETEKAPRVINKSGTLKMEDNVNIKQNDFDHYSSPYTRYPLYSGRSMSRYSSSALTMIS